MKPELQLPEGSAVLGDPKDILWWRCTMTDCREIYTKYSSDSMYTLLDVLVDRVKGRCRGARPSHENAEKSESTR